MSLCWFDTHVLMKYAYCSFFTRGVANHLGPGDGNKDVPPFRGSVNPINPSNGGGGGGGVGSSSNNPIMKRPNLPRPSGNALRPRNPQLANGGGNHNNNNNHRGYPGGSDKNAGKLSDETARYILESQCRHAKLCLLFLSWFFEFFKRNRQTQTDCQTKRKTDTWKCRICGV